MHWPTRHTVALGQLEYINRSRIPLERSSTHGPLSLPDPSCAPSTSAHHSLIAANRPTDRHSPRAHYVRFPRRKRHPSSRSWDSRCLRPTTVCAPRTRGIQAERKTGRERTPGPSMPPRRGVPATRARPSRNAACAPSFPSCRGYATAVTRAVRPPSRLPRRMKTTGIMTPPRRLRYRAAPSASQGVRHCGAVCTVDRSPDGPLGAGSLTTRSVGRPPRSLRSPNLPGLLPVFDVLLRRSVRSSCKPLAFFLSCSFAGKDFEMDDVATSLTVLFLFHRLWACKRLSLPFGVWYRTLAPLPRRCIQRQSLPDVRTALSAQYFFLTAYMSGHVSTPCKAFGVPQCFSFYGDILLTRLRRCLSVYVRGPVGA